MKLFEKLKLKKQVKKFASEEEVNELFKKYEDFESAVQNLGPLDHYEIVTDSDPEIGTGPCVKMDLKFSIDVKLEDWKKITITEEKKKEHITNIGKMVEDLLISYMRGI